jgi:putative flippase GtrA
MEISKKQPISLFLYLVVGMVPVFASFGGLTWLARNHSMPIAIATMAALFIAVQALYWAALRWHFGTRDLI